MRDIKSRLRYSNSNNVGMAAVFVEIGFTEKESLDHFEDELANGVWSISHSFSGSKMDEVDDWHCGKPAWYKAQYVEVYLPANMITPFAAAVRQKYGKRILGIKYFKYLESGEPSVLKRI